VKLVLVDTLHVMKIVLLQGIHNKTIFKPVTYGTCCVKRCVLRVAANVVVLVEAAHIRRKNPSYSAVATPVLSCCPPSSSKVN